MYNLYVTRADGSTFKTLRSPYPAREDMASTVRMILLGAPPYDRDLAARMADVVITTPLDETVTHPEISISFRTEEA